jgi:hypothetical protein
MCDVSGAASQCRCPLFFYPRASSSVKKTHECGHRPSDDKTFQWWIDPRRGKGEKKKWGNWLSLLGRALDGDPATDVLATPGPSKRLAQFHGNAQSIQLGLAQCGADFKEAAKVKVLFKGIFLKQIRSSISKPKASSNVVETSLTLFCDTFNDGRSEADSSSSGDQ